MSVNAAPAPVIEPWIEALLAEADAATERGNPALASALLQRTAAASRAPGVRRRAGLDLARAGRMAEAAEALRSALVTAPADAEVRYALGLALLALGRSPEGAALAEARFELPALGARKPPAFPYPEWRGEPLAGKHLVLFPELGLGDQLLAARFIPMLKAARITLFCPPPLVRLYADSFPEAAVVPASGEVAFEDPDAWTMITSLHASLRPKAAPPAPCLRAAAGRRGPEPRVGLAVGAMPQEAAARLLADLPGDPIPLTAAGSLAETAASMAACDLVVSADADLIQLASGLARPTLALVGAYDAHWSLALGAPTEAWHPTVEVFRCDPRQGWDSTLDRMVRAAVGRVAG